MRYNTLNTLECIKYQYTTGAPNYAVGSRRANYDDRDPQILIINQH